MNRRAVLWGAIGAALPLHTHLFFSQAFLSGVGSEYARVVLYGQDVLWFAMSACLIKDLIFCRYLCSIRASLRGGFETDIRPWRTSFLAMTKRDSFISMRVLRAYIPHILILVLGATALALAPHWPSALVGLLRVVLGVGVIVASARATSLERHMALWGFAISMGVVSMLGVWQAYAQQVVASAFLGIAAQVPERLGTGVAWVEGARWLRPYATFPHPNIFGGMAVLGVLASFVLAQHTRTHARARLASVLAAACALGVLASVSRAAVLALVLVLSAWVWRAHGHRAWRHARMAWVGACMGVLAGAWLFSAPWLGRALPIAEQGIVLEARSTHERGEQLHAWWEWTKTHPWKALVGVGVYQSTLTRASTDAQPRPAWAYQPVHVAPIVFLWEVGAVNAFVLCWLAWRTRAKILPFVKTPHGAAMIIALIPMAFLDHYLWTQMSVWVAAGLIIKTSPHTA